MRKLAMLAAASLAMVGCVVEETPTGSAGAELTLECNEGQALICHVPPGNPENMHEVCVGLAAVQKHLEEHSDTVPGPCAGVCSGIDQPCLTTEDCCSPYECVVGTCISRT
jgi:hypothetical protein